MTTAQERIAELAALHGAAIPLAPCPRYRATDNEPTTTTKQGANVVLPLAWRRIADHWENRERRDLLKNLELRLACGVIARILGPEWTTRTNQHDNHEVVHTRGYGFRLRWNWRDEQRFEVSPLHRHQRDEPPTITMSASRTLGAIAGDIRRRIVDAGLCEAYEQHEASRKNASDKNRQQFEKIIAVAHAFGGRVRSERTWQRSGYPEASLSIGIARIGYGFHGDDIELELTTDIETATKLGAAFCRPNA